MSSPARWWFCLASLFLLADGPRWTDHISHGELLRLGTDERMEISNVEPPFLIQGVADDDYRGKEYGKIPWALGLLRSGGTGSAAT